MDQDFLHIHEKTFNVSLSKILPQEKQKSQPSFSNEYYVNGLKNETETK